jgi:hypothetical protein
LSLEYATVLAASYLRRCMRAEALVGQAVATRLPVSNDSMAA